MIEVPEELCGNCTFENFFYHCTKLTQENIPVIPIALYRNANPTILGNESPYIITNPEKGTLLLSGDIVFVLGDSQEQASQREKEYSNGLKDLARSEIGTGFKAQNQVLNEEMLDNVDDEVILQLVKKELSKTEKDRKKIKLIEKQKINIEKFSGKYNKKSFLDVVSEENEQRPAEIQRSVSDIVKIVMLDHRNNKLKKATMKEQNNKEENKSDDKESSLSDELQGEYLPEDQFSPPVKKQNNSGEQSNQHNNEVGITEESKVYHTISNPYKLNINEEGDPDIQNDSFVNPINDIDDIMKPEVLKGEGFSSFLPKFSIDSEQLSKMKLQSKNLNNSNQNSMDEEEESDEAKVT